MSGQDRTPYLDALSEYADRDPGRFHVPGHKGGVGADPALRAALGERTLALDIPALTWGIDVGEEPTPFAEAQRLAAEAWGARRTWWLVNGASQGNHVALLTLGHRGTEVVTQRNAHSSTIDALIMSGLRPTFVSPELDIAHGVTPDALERALAEADGAVGAMVVSPTYFGAVADVAGLAEVAHARGVPLVVDEAWGSHLRFSPRLPASALEVCERAVDRSGGELADIRTARSAVGLDLIAVVLRLYRQGGPDARRRCLDIIDRLTELGVYGVSDALADER